MKKEYIKPSLRTVLIGSTAILAGSIIDKGTPGEEGTPEPSGPNDNPWGIGGIIGD